MKTPKLFIVLLGRILSGPDFEWCLWRAYCLRHLFFSLNWQNWIFFNIMYCKYVQLMYSKSVVKLNDKITVYWKLRPVKSCIFGSGNIFSAAKIYTQCAVQWKYNWDTGKSCIFCSANICWLNWIHFPARRLNGIEMKDCLPHLILQSAIFNSCRFYEVEKYKFLSGINAEYFASRTVN